MSNRPDGKTSFSTHKLRSFESNIFHSDHFKLYEVIKIYLLINLNKRVIITPSLSKKDIFDYSKNSFVQVIKVSGYILDDTINDNDIFEALYQFFEYIFLELDMKDLSFLYKSFNEDSSQKELVYKIFKKI
jgi:hypothetical protein